MEELKITWRAVHGLPLARTPVSGFFSRNITRSLSNPNCVAIHISSSAFLLLFSSHSDQSQHPERFLLSLRFSRLRKDNNFYWQILEPSAATSRKRKKPNYALSSARRYIQDYRTLYRKGQCCPFIADKIMYTHTLQLECWLSCERAPLNWATFMLRNVRRFWMKDFSL